MENGLPALPRFRDGQKYSAERARNYLARLTQVTADDVLLWKDKVDQWGGTSLDAAVNIILLDDFFDKEKSRQDKFQTLSRQASSRPIRTALAMLTRSWDRR